MYRHRTSPRSLPAQPSLFHPKKDRTILCRRPATGVALLHPSKLATSRGHSERRSQKSPISPFHSTHTPPISHPARIDRSSRPRVPSETNCSSVRGRSPTTALNPCCTRCIFRLVTSHLELCLPCHLARGASRLACRRHSSYTEPG